ncbi:sugar ABC transporter substrate-binding protein [Micromonospora inyonensis]|uniref:Carbohydrate ABC transporter substrate-binding protein, CUT1 family n=1 Tax=Micromonospora inyonensis TaxID=47866 RepID=A0A1C6S521_9ACTN|nr:sugar ABC transporter substrate-binding protein [Micromonospora inyonensis]SCL24561.1 carbohydrate ABC transporter substrate-binding protein, CUT1 family [Micromonospora inyonensis]
MAKWTRSLVALGLAAVVMAAGCGRDDSDGPTGPGRSIGDGPATGELTVWAMGTEGEKLSVLADAFMKENPDAKVTVTPIPWDGAHDKIATAIAGRQTPDVSLVGTTWMGEFAGTGGLDPTPADLVDKDAFFPGAWDTTVVDGTSHGVPWYVETRLLYVNKAVAARSGITHAPTTWEELKSALTALRTRGGAKWAVSLPPGGPGSWQAVLPFVWQNGGDVRADGVFTLDRPETVEALAYYRSFFDEGLAPKDLAQGALEPGFVKGEIGAFVSGPWHIGVLKEQGAGDNFQLWHMPRRKAATSFVGGGNLAVFSDAKNRAGAWKFVSYLSRPDVQVTWYRTASDLPSVKRAWEDPVLRDDPQLRAFGAQLEDAKSPPAIATWEQVAAGLESEIERLTRTGASPQDTAREMQRKATAIGAGS